ncbi:DUF3293 domain-containing protein [Saccharobesus litoralis]|uniref:DUF3293 domain-containing protein n=1 Tax=Saccharobesus litoralis TaxID=2172099 RepID=A0A2S0VRC4_9ALTE|nr:DUF3293 domain-containing protein [Saccharobesus litoralis]AWB66732.1 DUF3293 domain-containing protein [Saccharobesus litoralis]
MQPSSSQLWSLYKTTQFVMAQSLSQSLNFAIITAFNPLGQLRSPSFNTIQDKALQYDIQRLNTVYRSIYGCSADLSYSEKSWLVAIEQSTAIDLAIEYKQNAIYFVNGDRLSLVPCLLADQQEDYIGSFQQRTRIFPANVFR